MYCAYLETRILFVASLLSPLISMRVLGHFTTVWAPHVVASCRAWTIWINVNMVRFCGDRVFPGNRLRFFVVFIHLVVILVEIARRLDIKMESGKRKKCSGTILWFGKGIYFDISAPINIWFILPETQHLVSKRDRIRFRNSITFHIMGLR